MPNEPAGCLGFLFKLFPGLTGGGVGGVGGGGVQVWPYATKKYLFSQAEFSFYRVLQQACGGRYVVCPKVGLGDLLYVQKGTEGGQAWRNKIDRKHVDFVLCDPQTMTVIAAVELDDASHGSASAQKRDADKDKACRDAGLQLLRFPARKSYNLEEVRAKLAEIESS